MRWDPDIYRRHLSARLRPGLDLLAAVPEVSPDLVVDLGCGTGELTEQLARRWPDAEVMGLDVSEEMLATARRERHGMRWVAGDLRTWEPERPPGVVFSNAALHWIDDHRDHLTRLVSLLAPGGVLAVQMPSNFHAPSHRAMARCAREQPWRDRLIPLLRSDPVHSPATYHRILTSAGADPEVWTTEYLHRLEGESPVYDWVSGTALRPLLESLLPSEQDRFSALLRRRLAEAYPREPDGSVLFGFRRLFFVAVRQG